MSKVVDVTSPTQSVLKATYASTMTLSFRGKEFGSCTETTACAKEEIRKFVNDFSNVHLPTMLEIINSFCAAIYSNAKNPGKGIILFEKIEQGYVLITWQSGSGPTVREFF